ARRAEDAGPGFAWARVLARRRAGEHVAAAFSLAEALTVAPLVAPLLLARGSRLPEPESAGSLDAWRQAERAARALLPAWAATPAGPLTVTTEFRPNETPPLPKDPAAREAATKEMAKKAPRAAQAPVPLDLDEARPASVKQAPKAEGRVLYTLVGGAKKVAV